MVVLMIVTGVLTLTVTIVYLKVGHRDSLFVAVVLLWLAFWFSLALPLLLEG